MRLTIVIIEFHCMSDVEKCIESVAQHLEEVDYECIVVSNSSYSESELAMYRLRIGKAVLLPSGGNRGYAGGVNKGLSKAVGEYIYVLNPDCLLQDDGVIEIMLEMDKVDEWAFSGPKVVDDQGVVQPSCRRFPKPWTFLLVRSKLKQLPFARREQARYLMQDYDRKDPKAVDWLSGGAIIVKKSTLKVIGGMDERYFLYMEDVDWCRACNNKNYVAKYVPFSVVEHAGQHASISGSVIQRIKSPHLRYHLVSMFKYFLKGLRAA